MSEWASLLATFWALFAINGLGWHRWAAFHFNSFFGGARAGGVRHGAWRTFSAWPAGWRYTVADVPVTLSPDGIANVPAGAAARPAPLPDQVQAWQWHDIETVEVRRGWLRINGRRFAPATGHVSTAVIRELRDLPTANRIARLEALTDSWLRPIGLRRRIRLMRLATHGTVSCNLAAFGLALLVTAYLSFNGADRLPGDWGVRITRALPLFVGYGLVLHIAAIVLGWRAARRLQRHGGRNPGELLSTAILLPPQALQLRATLAHGFLPAVHPLTAALACARPRERERVAFNVINDLRWPAGWAARLPELARAIWTDHRARLQPRIERMATAGGIDLAALTAAPIPESAQSCAWCPRCHDQFILPAGVCPHGVPLQSFRTPTKRG